MVPLFAAPVYDVPDPQDTRGSLDIRKIHVDPNRPPKFSLVSYRTFTVAELWDTGYALVHFDTSGDEHFEYYVLVRSNGERMRADLFRDRRSKPDYRVRWIRAAHPSPSRIYVRVPLGELNIPESRSFYRWYANTTFTSYKCPATCIDRIPDAGAITQELLAPVP
jgi:hypothetical protein